MFGIALALLSALAFGLSQILVRKNLDKSNFVYISLTVTIIGNIILWPLALTFTNLSTINPEGLLLFIVAGLLAPGIARLFYFKGMETAGISANASIFATYPLYTSIVAILLLGEALTAENWIGLVCVVAGVIFVGRNINKIHIKKGLHCPHAWFFCYRIFPNCKKGRLEHLQPTATGSCSGVHHSPHRLPSSNGILQGL